MIHKFVLLTLTFMLGSCAFSSNNLDTNGILKEFKQIRKCTNSLQSVFFMGQSDKIKLMHTCFLSNRMKAFTYLIKTNIVNIDDRNTESDRLIDIVTDRLSKEKNETVKNLYLKRLETLISFGANIEGTDSLVMNPLSVACINNDITTAEFLISKKANVNKTTTENNPPLLYALCSGNIEIVDLLISHGAYINFSDPEENGLMNLYFKTIKSKLDKDEDIIFLMNLLDRGFDINKKNNKGKTPLHEAVRQQKSPKFIYALTKLGADVLAKDSNGNTAFFYASIKYYDRVIFSTFINILNEFVIKDFESMCGLADKNHVFKNLDDMEYDSFHQISFIFQNYISDAEGEALRFDYTKGLTPVVLLSGDKVLTKRISEIYEENYFFPFSKISKRLRTLRTKGELLKVLTNTENRSLYKYISAIVGENYIKGYIELLEALDILNSGIRDEDLAYIRSFKRSVDFLTEDINTPVVLRTWNIGEYFLEA